MVAVNGPVEVVGGAVNFVAAGIGSRVTMSGQTVTLSNNPAFTTFAEAFSGVIRARSVTFSEAAACSRYLAAAGGAIDTAGAGANYFPGSAAGSSPTGF